MNYSIFTRSDINSDIEEYLSESSDNNKEKLVEDNSSTLLKKKKRRGMKIKRGINCSWTIEEVK